MDHELLRAFVAVADSGGFGLAGRSLNRTQSAVSLQIKRLEQQLDETLFARTSRSVALTPAGERLLPYARRILLLQEEARTAVARDDMAEILRFGIPDEQALIYLPELLAAFTRGYPALQLEIVCEQSPVLVEQLQNGQLDLVLAIRHQPTLTGMAVMSQPLCWVAADDFRVPNRVPLAVNPDGCVYRAQAIERLSRVGRDWRIVYTSQSPTGINLALLSGLAVAVKATRSVPEGCRILTDELPALSPAVIELHRSPASHTPALEAFADCLIERIRRSGSQPRSSFQ